MIKIKQSDLERIASRLAESVAKLTDDEIIRRASALMESKRINPHKRFVNTASAYKAGYGAGFMAGSRQEPTRKPRTVAKTVDDTGAKSQAAYDALKRKIEALRKSAAREGYHVRIPIEAWREFVA